MDCYVFLCRYEVFPEDFVDHDEEVVDDEEGDGDLLENKVLTENYSFS